MSDHLIDLVSSSTKMVPVVALLAGFGGSLHCVGMCGPLVTSIAPKRSSNLSYQAGRFVSYSLLGLFGGLLGQIFTIQQLHPSLTLLPSLLLGGMLIAWGYQSYVGENIFASNKISFPLIGKIHLKLTKKAYSAQNKSAFLVGLLSILLPCGLLYGVVLSLATLQSPLIALISMIGFWLGTLPAMVFGPEFAKALLSPAFNKWPKISSLTLIAFGLMTISLRVYEFITTGRCHY